MKDDAEARRQTAFAFIVLIAFDLTLLFLKQALDWRIFRGRDEDFTWAGASLMLLAAIFYAASASGFLIKWRSTKKIRCGLRMAALVFLGLAAFMIVGRKVSGKRFFSVSAALMILFQAALLFADPEFRFIGFVRCPAPANGSDGESTTSASWRP